MSYAHPPPLSRRLSGLVVITGLHVVGLYVLLNGLARDTVHALIEPVVTRIIHEAPPPPPPPPPPRREIVRQVRQAPPPPPIHAPPPEVVVEAPPVEHIAATAVPTPPAPPSPPAPPQPPAPVAPPAAPAIATAGVVCPNSDQIRANTRYPAVAQRRNIEGDVLIEFLVPAVGGIENIRVLGPANTVLASAALEATRKFHCESQGQPVRVQVSYTFQLG